MLQVFCSGSPSEIGHQHGTQAKGQVLGSLAFYRSLFEKKCACSWDKATQLAGSYVASLEEKCPRYLDEMRGIADGAGVGFLDILALNVRTEIVFGLWVDSKIESDNVKSDGCTSLGYFDGGGGGASWLAQNWDWQVEQSPNLIVCRISQPGLPDIAMVTEGGIVGKIGLNSHGVGVGLNAIRARGVDASRLPVHLALRAVLDSPSRNAAVKKLAEVGGLAGSAHILLGDGDTGAVGLECTSVDTKELRIDDEGIVVHANNFLLEHPGVDEVPWLGDELLRAPRLRELLVERLQKRRQEEGNPSPKLQVEDVFELFKDEKRWPRSINRSQGGGSETQTLFNIVMDLAAKKAIVSVGRPSEVVERVELSFSGAA